MDKAWILLAAIMVVTPAVAADNGKDYTYCTVAGFYAGNGRTFLADIALRNAFKDGRIVANDPVCTDAYKKAIKVGAHFAKTGQLKSESDKAIFVQSTKFSQQVYDAILKSAGLE